MLSSLRCGELDGATAPQLAQHLEAHVEAAPVVVDLRQVTFIDSHGLVVLLSALEGIRTAGSDVVFRSPEKRVRRVFEICGLEGLFDPA